METVKFDDFKKMRIRTAKVLKVEDHPNADKLYVLTITTGEAQKVIVAGIKRCYKPEDIIGKNIVIVDSLEPADIRGVTSTAMLLAAKDGETLSLLVPEREVSVGSVIS